MRLNERGVRIAGAVIAALMLLPLSLSRLAADNHPPAQHSSRASVLKDDGLACSRFGGQNQ